MRYDYSCGDHTFEIEKGILEEPEIYCPVCGLDARRLFEVKAVIFTGRLGKDYVTGDPDKLDAWGTYADKIASERYNFMEGKAKSYRPLTVTRK